MISGLNKYATRYGGKITVDKTKPSEEDSQPQMRKNTASPLFKTALSPKSEVGLFLGSTDCSIRLWEISLYTETWH